MLRGSNVEQNYDAATTSMLNARSQMRYDDGLIPTQSEFYFVVDCPSLHIVSGNDIGPRRLAKTDTGFSTFDHAFHAFCPQCRQVISKTRQITIAPSIPSPDLETPLSMVGIGEDPWLRPEVVSTQNDPLIQRSISTTTIRKSKRMGFISRFISPSPTTKKQKPSGPARSGTSSDITLPTYLSFCFSLSGKNLILWEKDGQDLVRIEVESCGSRLLGLKGMLPASDAVNIRYVAEGNDWICVLISHNRQLILLVLHSSGLREKSALHFINEQPDPRALAISPDNSFIAVGFGTRIHLFNYQGCHQQWRTILTVPDFTISTEVKFQVVNFSSDNTTLAVATQRHDISRSVEDDAISTYIWKCTGHPRTHQKMGACKMPTDGQGLTSIYHSPTLSLSLILGASPTPYPLFLSPSSSCPLPIPHDITEFRIRCACLSPPPNTHVAYMMDVKNKVFKIDLRARSVVQIGDLNMERGALTVLEEAAAMGVTAEGKVRLFWRQGGGLWVCALEGEGIAEGEKEKKNLRGVWVDAWVGV